MVEVDNETSIQWLIVLLKSILKITVIGRLLFKLLLKTCSHMFFETQCTTVAVT